LILGVCGVAEERGCAADAAERSNERSGVVAGVKCAHAAVVGCDLSAAGCTHEDVHDGPDPGEASSLEKECVSLCGMCGGLGAVVGLEAPLGVAMARRESRHQWLVDDARCVRWNAAASNDEQVLGFQAALCGLSPCGTDADGDVHRGSRVTRPPRWTNGEVPDRRCWRRSCRAQQRGRIAATVRQVRVRA